MKQKILKHILHIDALLFLIVGLISLVGFIILYSAGDQSHVLLAKQGARLALAFSAMILFAQIPPHKYRQWIPHFFTAALVLLIVVLIIGKIGKGAQRWIDIGILRFEPSEFMKMLVPMTLAWFFHDKELPPNFKHIATATLIFLVPAFLIAKQPDLGTACIVAFSGIATLFLAGLSWRIILGGLTTMLVSAPIVWHALHTYQKERVLTFLDPQRDPHGQGYHIIQSKIAIGSGGLIGKGWLHGTQTHLQFLPEHSTDFIFSVFAEEFGLIGCLILISLFAALTLRGLYISLDAPDTFTRLVAGSLSIVIFMSVGINIGMVTGILPVVGVPLPFVSYGGTSTVIMMACLGVIMSIHTHRRMTG